MTTDSFNDLLGSDTALAFKFENIGDTCKGKVVSAKRQQAKDIETGEPRFFKNSGDPIMQLIVTIELDDGTQTAVYANGGNYETVEGKGQSMLEALKAAVGEQEFRTGGLLAVQYSGNGKKTNPAFSAPKLYTVQYKAPAINLAADEDLF